MRISPILSLVLGGTGTLGAVVAWVSVWWSGKQHAADIERVTSELEAAKTSQSLAVQRLQNELRSTETKLDSEVSKLRAELDAADKRHLVAVNEMQSQRKKADDEESVNRVLSALLNGSEDQRKRSFSAIKKSVPMEDEALREALRRIGARQFWTKGAQPEELWGIADAAVRS